MQRLLVLRIRSGKGNRAVNKAFLPNAPPNIAVQRTAALALSGRVSSRPLTAGSLGGMSTPYRHILNGLFWKLRSGAPWRDIPERYGPWQTIYDRYVFWRRDGTWDKMLHALQLQLDTQGKIDWQQWNVDSTTIRASRAAAGARRDGL